jgi:hypothetical protein
MTETRRRGRPKGTTLGSMGEYELVEALEAQLDSVVDQRASALEAARSSTERGFESAEDAMVRKYHERARQARREEWLSFHDSMHRLHARLSQEHAEKYEALLNRAVEAGAERE